MKAVSLCIIEIHVKEAKTAEKNVRSGYICMGIEFVGIYVAGDRRIFFLPERGNRSCSIGGERPARL